jgi:LacI family transcriptional regulator
VLNAVNCESFVSVKNNSRPEPDHAEPEATAPASDERVRGRLTINDIARMAEVSKKTVSRVINRSPFVKVETREKIDAIIREYGFQPDPQARGLAFRRSFLIGMVYDNPNPQYVVHMQQGILDGLKGSGFELVIHPSDREIGTFPEEIVAFVERQKLSGVVLTPPVSEDQRLADLLRAAGVPFVRIASIGLDDPQRMIVTHDHLGGATVARHLAELGHARIAHISGPASFLSAHERRRGFSAALAESGIELRPEYDRAGAYTYDSGMAAARELLALDPRPTAIFAGNDEMAAGVYQVAREFGLSIPDDLSVVGYDDAPAAARMWPPLTTIRLPIRDMGRVAAEKLMAERHREPGTKAALSEVAPTLIVRGSTAAPRQS